MNIKTLRILSKTGLLMVMIGFFMPVACNLNGFEMARYASTFDSGINLLTVSLYGIFIFSCLGVILLLLIAFGKQFSIKWDWVASIGTVIFAIIAFTNLNGGKDNWSGNIFQSGAYFILIGIIASICFLFMCNNKSIPIKNTSSSAQTVVLKAFCSQCGNKITPEHLYCSKCGAKI